MEYVQKVIWCFWCMQPRNENDILISVPRFPFEDARFNSFLFDSFNVSDANRIVVILLLE